MRHDEVSFLWSWRLLVAVAFTAATSACAAISFKDGGVPQWCVDGTHPAYPKTAFILGVGSTKASGNNEEDNARATANARAQVAKQIQVGIEEVQVSREWEVSAGQQTSGGHDVRQMTLERVNFTLEGVDIVERFESKAKGVLYCLAVLNRDNAQRSLQAKLKGSLKRANRYLRKGNQAIDEARVLPALSLYMQAHSEMLKILSNGSILRVLSDGKARLPEVAIADVTSRISSILTGLQIEAIEGDDQKGEKGKPLLDPLVVQVVLTGRGEPAPVSGLPITFTVKDEGARWEPAAQTGADGTARTHILAIGQEDVSESHVIATVDWSAVLETMDSSLRPHWSKQLKPLTTTFTFTKTERGITSTRVAVRIVEYIDDIPRTQQVVTPAVSDALLAEKFDVTDARALRDLPDGQLLTAKPARLLEVIGDAADVVVLGQVRDSLSSKGGAGFIFHRAQATVRAIDLGSGRIMAEVTHVEKGAGSTDQKAAKAALTSMAKVLSKKIAAAVKRGLR